MALASQLLSAMCWRLQELQREQLADYRRLRKIALEDQQRMHVASQERLAALLVAAAADEEKSIQTGLHGLQDVEVGSTLSDYNIQNDQKGSKSDQKEGPGCRGRQQAVGLQHPEW